MVALIATCFASARAAHPRYAITQLPAISTAVEMYAYASDIDDAGNVVGVETTIGYDPLPLPVRNKTKPLRWNLAGQPSYLSLPAGAIGGHTATINDLGTVRGTYYLALSPPINDTVTWNAAGTPTTYSAQTPVWPQVIGNADVIVGRSANNTLVVQRNGTVAPLILPQGTSYASAISATRSGQVLANTGSSGFLPYLLTTHSAAQRVFPLVPNFGGSIADMNDSAVMVGSSWDTQWPGSFNATRFVNGQAQVLNLLSGSLYHNSRALGINDRGDILGTSGSGWYSSTTARLLMWRDGQVLDLRQLIDGTLPIGFMPMDINNRGQIIGNVFFDHDNNPDTPSLNFVYRLDPIRSPGDTNYDAVVNFDDLLVVAQNYGKSGNGIVFWETGDLNFDWSVDFDDLLILAQHYTGGSGVAAALGEGFAADWALARTLVPEPTSLWLLVAVGPALGRRRKDA